MSENIKIGLIGGDLRAAVIAERLIDRYECAAWGLEQLPPECVRCADYRSAVRGADGVILPLPVTRGGGLLNCVGEVPIDDVCRLLKPGAILMGGMIPPRMSEAALERGAAVFDYYASEGVQIKNAVPTAEGTIAALISEMPVTIAGMRITVTGYGRCARALAERLRLLGAEVYVAARSERDLAWAWADGCAAVRLGEYLASPVDCEAIVNTVPVRLFDEKVLGRLDGHPVIFDISGGCVGVDPLAAERYAVRVVSLPSLPGKTAPETAGGIIADAVIARFDEHFGKGGGI